MKPYSLSRSWHRLTAVAAASAILLSTVGGALAKDTHYTDVPAGIWYEEAAAALLESGALDSSESRLRPNDLATRAEVLKLLVNVYGEDLVYPATPSFSDVPKTVWYYPYVEASARAGWLKGDGECYGKGLSRCTARPAAQVNRAEMATLLQRAYQMAYLKLAPEFPDNPRSQWYHDPVQTAADHCILEGDGGLGTVRPAASMNRAEMVVMMHRASMGMRYGDDCGTQVTGNILSVTTASPQRVRVSFNVDLDANRIDDPLYYSMERVGGGDVNIDDISVVDGRTVEFHLSRALEEGELYRVFVTNMRTERGVSFSDSQTFVFRAAEIEASIESATATDIDTVRVVFSEDVAPSYADDAARYMVERTSNGVEVGVNNVTVVNARTVDVNLNADLVTGATYRLRVENMRTSDQRTFTDSTTFSTSISVDATIESVTVISSTRLRVTFSHDLDSARAEDEIRYRVNGADGDLNIDSVGLIDDHVVEIILNESLTSQDLYTVSATNLQTTGGVTFSDDMAFVYAPGNVSFSTTLNGLKEVPPNVSGATGTGTFTLTSAGLQYDITLKNISGSLITGAHFHNAHVGVSGPVVEPISFNTSTLRATGTWTDLTAEERSQLLNGDIYVNVHTNAYPNGEIRGQLTH